MAVDPTIDPKHMKHISKYTFTPSERVGIRVNKLAADALVHISKLGLDAVDPISTLEAALQHLPTPMKDPQLEELLGALLAQIVHERFEGTWGHGQVYTAPIPVALRLKDRLTFWPESEIRQRLRGHSDLSISACLKGLEEALAKPPHEPPTTRLYPLAGDHCVITGLTCDQRQVLFGEYQNCVCAFFFALDGEYLGHITRNDSRAGHDAVRQWQDDLGFRRTTIHVKKFSEPEFDVGIEDLPWTLLNFIKDPDSEPDPKERKFLNDFLQEWLESDSFVFRWGNDLWIDKTGQVTDS